MKYYIDAFRFPFRRVDSSQWNQEVGMIRTTFGNIRLRDTKGDKPALIIIPDGPNVIEHYNELVALLQADFRLLIFELPGFGFSTHQGQYDYSFQKTTQLIREIIDRFHLKKVNLAFPCSHGFYGLAFAQAHPDYVQHLTLIQTPSLPEMAKWSARIVPQYLKIPVLGQLIMPWIETTFAKRWYEYALPKGKDRAPFQQTALNGIHTGGCFCLSSLTQSIAKEAATDFDIDPAIPVLSIYGKNDFTHRDTNFETLKTYALEAQFVAYDNCGHFPDLEFPQEYSTLLKEKLL
jgi:pimeloyl-ACP methyl ester carboxylesterase